MTQTPQSTTHDAGNPRLTASHHAGFLLLEVLVVQGRVHETRRDRMHEATAVLTKALEIALKAHRRGGCTPGQLHELEVCRTRMEDLAK